MLNEFDRREIARGESPLSALFPVPLSSLVAMAALGAPKRSARRRLTPSFNRYTLQIEIVATHSKQRPDALINRYTFTVMEGPKASPKTE
jgi:hypothetical protein